MYGYVVLRHRAAGTEFLTEAAGWSPRRDLARVFPTWRKAYNAAVRFNGLTLPAEVETERRSG